MKKKGKPNAPLNIPRLLVLVIDSAIVTLAFFLSLLVVLQFDIQLIADLSSVLIGLSYPVVAAITFYILRIHAGVIRYSTLQDMTRLFLAIIFSSILFYLIIKCVFYFRGKSFFFNLEELLLVNFFISSSTLTLTRVAGKLLYNHLNLKRTPINEREKVLIAGMDDNAILIKQALEADLNRKYQVVGFVHDLTLSRKLSIQQKKVFSYNDLTRLHSLKYFDKLILINSAPNELHSDKIVNLALELGIKVSTVPPSDQWVHGKLKIKQIQELRIEDLLQREEIRIDNINVLKELAGKKILITGAAGSIGSEIVRQVMQYRPLSITLVDQAESPLYDVQLELEELYPTVSVKTYIANIRNYNRMKYVFENSKPNIVFHAAAYKHVPMMERHVSEAILTNVVGTRNLAVLSVIFQVNKFIMVSTDKAVNPTNIMGASKRLAEIYIQSLSESPNCRQTKFITTRFGNVMDSNGSVIPRFKRQIAKGGPVTVTHPDIVRYFMTIPEAVQLVLEAGTTGNGGEIFIFDMGKPVKIYDLALNMIKLAGLSCPQDIQIVFTGLRPGEKLFEELLNDTETTIATHNPKIKKAKVAKYPFKQVSEEVRSLTFLARRGAIYLIVKKMKEMVPEFKSKNSTFEELDMETTISKVNRIEVLN
ncbi:MAG: polysaccharide biosynthesis protein [Bacteroidetes bacterium]|nr:polysaccharide biosynthesis protein [Bacteroidota bacterium]